MKQAILNEVPKDLIEVLGKAGLLERLDKKTFAAGMEHHESLIALVKGLKPERSFGIGDDFIPDVEVYNAVGAIYSSLSRKLKDEALKSYLEQFDMVNCGKVRDNHTFFIREPLVLADVSVVRQIYWPGLYEGRALVQKYKDRKFMEFEKEMITIEGLFDPAKIKSDFLVAYALLRKDISPYQSDFVKACHPGFLERVVKGIVNMRFGGVEAEEGIEKRQERLRELLPQELHSLIDKHYELKDWPNRADFRY